MTPLCPLQDLASILDEEARFPVAGLGRDELAYVGGGDGSMILDHDVCFLQGDLNYRIDLRRENVISSLRAGERAYLLEHDQLLKEMRNNPGFRLRTFSEAPIAFECVALQRIFSLRASSRLTLSPAPACSSPTYKYNRGTHDYDTSEKKRVPAWCDRILYRSRVPENVEALHCAYLPTFCALVCQLRPSPPPPSQTRATSRRCPTTSLSRPASTSRSAACASASATRSRPASPTSL